VNQSTMSDSEEIALRMKTLDGHESPATIAKTVCNSSLPLSPSFRHPTLTLYGCYLCYYVGHSASTEGEGVRRGCTNYSFVFQLLFFSQLDCWIELFMNTIAL